MDGRGVVEQSEGYVSRAACNIEERLRLGGRAGVEASDEVVFPQSVRVERHEVVHCVVGGGNGGEYSSD